MNRQNDLAKRSALKVLIGGMLGMVVAMGIGRFSYTPVLPLMLRDLGISNSLAGWLATHNYLGYLVGALLCTMAPQLLRNRLVTGGALLVCITSTAFMGMTDTSLIWGILRFASGFASAILFLVISAEVAETLAQSTLSHWLGGLYAGIGLGIALSGLLVPWLDQLGGWSGAWIGIGGFALLLSVLGLALGRQRADINPATFTRTKQSSLLHNLWPLATAYFMEGLGYVVTATFIVAIIATTPGLEPYAPYSWVAVGIAAIPSTMVWPLLARRIGNKPALLAAYILQAIGILVSINATTVLAVLFAAVSFGGTFLGIVVLTLAEGNRRCPADSRRAAALLTTGFSLGQIFGPAIAGILADLQSGFSLPLLLAAGCVITGGLFILFDRTYTTP